MDCYHTTVRTVSLLKLVFSKPAFHIRFIAILL
nr:MAG TPA: hypothetical protein [Caudoviricetes sp.]DAY34948.1 MAG TPA: hypothetical protein [Bacteriophage sp.]